MTTVGNLNGRRGAEISPDGMFRFRLWRRWGDGRQMTFIMLNPSIADASVDDPTLRRCIGFAQREGCDGVQLVNLYPYRTHKPKYLLEARDAGIDISGGQRGKEAVVKAMSNNGDLVVAAWGAHDIAAESEARQLISVINQAEHAGGRLFCFGRTKDGSPRHPLYLKSDAPLEPWP